MPKRRRCRREAAMSAHADERPDPVREALRLTQLSHGGG
jgi:hypothetical protein